MKSDCLNRDRFNSIINTIAQAEQLVQTVVAYRDHNLRADIVSMESLKNYINRMDIDENKETFAFENDLVSSIYKRQIEQFERFLFLRKSNKFFDVDSVGIIEFSIILPFNTKEWKNISDCLNSSQLPPFYANKTRK